jgi:DNA-binding IscR family transcriptional regulator
MRRDSRLSGVLHVLLHMAEQDGPVTSEVMAKAMTTNPVVIRRLMAGLRDAGYVRAENGHGGGWTRHGRQACRAQGQPACGARHAWEVARAGAQGPTVG